MKTLLRPSSCCRLIPVTLLIASLAAPVLAASTASATKTSPAAVTQSVKTATIKKPVVLATIVNAPAAKLNRHYAGTTDLRFSDPLRWRSQMTCDGLKDR
jgi:hypothetical protein